MSTRSILFLALIEILAFVLSSCHENEDPGPLRYAERPFAVVDFDRIEVGDAMFVTVRQGPLFSVAASGDGRNLDDLVVQKLGSTLMIRFDRNNNRRHTTSIDISLPSLRSAIFSGATVSTIAGFTEVEPFFLGLSGASTAQLNVEASSLEVSASGASNLTLSGTSAVLDADLSSASLLKAYTMDVENAKVSASGASHAYVNVMLTLDAIASGASSILYRGDAIVNSSTSGASAIIKD
ncbi:MAG: head GIN domain-containing protein [Cyclobacteriaceae bacterium]